MGFIERGGHLNVAGCWIHRIAENLTFGDEVLADLFGVDHNRMKRGILSEDIHALIHPSDLPGLLKNAQQSVEYDQPYEASFRVAGFRGGERWLTARGRCFPDEHGRPREFVGTTALMTSLDTYDNSLGRLTDILIEGYQVAKTLDDSTIKTVIGVLLTNIARDEAAAQMRDASENPVKRTDACATGTDNRQDRGLARDRPGAEQMSSGPASPARTIPPDHVGLPWSSDGLRSPSASS